MPNKNKRFTGGWIIALVILIIAKNLLEADFDFINSSKFKVVIYSIVGLCAVAAIGYARKDDED